MLMAAKSAMPMLTTMTKRHDGRQMYAPYVLSIRQEDTVTRRVPDAFLYYPFGIKLHKQAFMHSPNALLAYRHVTDGLLAQFTNEFCAKLELDPAEVSIEVVDSLPDIDNCQTLGQFRTRCNPLQHSLFACKQHRILLLESLMADADRLRHTLAHELTHFLIHRQSHAHCRKIPSFLEEGLCNLIALLLTTCQVPLEQGELVICAHDAKFIKGYQQYCQQREVLKDVDKCIILSGAENVHAKYQASCWRAFEAMFENVDCASVAGLLRFFHGTWQTITFDLRQVYPYIHVCMRCQTPELRVCHLHSAGARS